MFHKTLEKYPVPVPPLILKACLRPSRTPEAIRRYPHASRLLAFFSRSTVAWRHEASTASAALPVTALRRSVLALEVHSTRPLQSLISCHLLHVCR
jgi:hypothetical protein